MAVLHGKARRDRFWPLFVIGVAVVFWAWAVFAAVGVQPIGGR